MRQCTKLIEKTHFQDITPHLVGPGLTKLSRISTTRDKSVSRNGVWYKYTIQMNNRSGQRSGGFLSFLCIIHVAYLEAPSNIFICNDTQIYQDVFFNIPSQIGTQLNSTVVKCRNWDVFCASLPLKLQVRYLRYSYCHLMLTSTERNHQRGKVVKFYVLWALVKPMKRDYPQHVMS